MVEGILLTGVLPPAPAAGEAARRCCTRVLGGPCAPCTRCAARLAAALMRGVARRAGADLKRFAALAQEESGFVPAPGGGA